MAQQESLEMAPAPASGPLLRRAIEVTLDRLMHRAAMLEFEGKSYRLKEAASRIALSAVADS